MWCLYILECRTGELYVGITDDLAERIKKHNAGTACRYTKYRGPVRLVYQELCGEYGDARKREHEVKKFSRKKKLLLGQGVRVVQKSEDLSP